ncbi:MAG: hypothetical protein WCD44_03800 [Candidatus Babeliales bacterium]
MKKYALTFFLLLCFITYLRAGLQEVFGRSFMFTRPAYYNTAMQQQLWHSIIYNKKGNSLASFQLTTFYQHSIDQRKTQRYFLIKGKNELLVSGDANETLLATRDVRAEWLNLPDDFKGNLAIKPEQQQLGFFVEYHQDLKQWIDHSFFNGSFLDISIPVVSVENDLNLMQFNVANKSLNTPQDIIGAFQQPAWKYSKITGKRSRFGVAEIKASFGRSYLSEDYFQIVYSSSFTIPVAKKQDPQFIFDPVIGNNRYIGLGGAVNFQILLNSDPSQYAFCFFINFEAIFLIRNKQFRTFDLKRKPWSRFLLYNKQGAKPNQNIPGVNLLTVDTVSYPFGMFDFSGGWRIQNEKFEIELGYNAWGHGDEHLRLRRKFTETFGIAGSRVDITASQSTINQQAADDTMFTPVTETDLNLDSAASRSALTHKAFLTGGFKKIGKKIDSFIGAGSFVEIPQKNSALKNWGIWGKLGTSF